KTPQLQEGTPFTGYLTKLLFDNNNNIWCGTNKGLFKYSISTNIMRPVKYKLISEEVQGSIWIKGMTWLNDSSIIFSTYAGLYKINNNNFRLARETCNNKLSLTDIRSIFKRENKLWIFGEKGLYVFDETNQQGRTYTVEDGLSSNEFSFSSLVLNPDQKCVVGTTNGLVSFNPGQLQGAITPPGAQLTGIYINDVLYAATPSSNEINKIDLSLR